MFSTVPSASPNTVVITLPADVTMRHFLGGGKETRFQAIPCTLRSGIKWWSQVSSIQLKSWNKVVGIFVDRMQETRWCVNSICLWTSDNIRGTHRADTFFISKVSVKIECMLPVEMPTDSAMKQTDSRRLLVTSFLTFSTVSSLTELAGRPHRSKSSHVNLRRLNSACWDFDNIYILSGSTWAARMCWSNKVGL